MRSPFLSLFAFLLLIPRVAPVLRGQEVVPTVQTESKSDKSDSNIEGAQPAAPNSPGQEALNRVKKLGFRLSPKGSASGVAADHESKKSNFSDEKSLALDAPGDMKVGRVQEPVELPSELADSAKEAALAVAEGKWSKAKELYTTMMKQAPENALVYANLGVVEYQMGNLTDASAHLQKSTEINPHIARNWQTLGLIQYEKGSLALALSSLTRALHEDPDQAETRVILAAVARDYGWIGTSIIELERAVELNPSLPTAHYNLALSYLEEKPPRIELARRHYYAAIDLGMKAAPDLEAALSGATESPKEAK